MPKPKLEQSGRFVTSQKGDIVFHKGKKPTKRGKKGER